MELIKEKWENKDIIEFQNFLKSHENKEKVEWATNLLKTNLPVLCLTTPFMKDIINKISKGNFLQFLDHMPWGFYENTAINGTLITKIEDFETMEKYLDIYSEKIDNWASSDLMIYNINHREKQFFDLAKKYIQNDKPFVKRTGINLLFYLIEDENYIDQIFSILNNFYEETNYYVNMINAWLLCECYIKQKEKTLKYFGKNNLNKFTINKAIQKCRESSRISKEEKDMLLKYKVSKQNKKDNI